MRQIILGGFVIGGISCSLATNGWAAPPRNLVELMNSRLEQDVFYKHPDRLTAGVGPTLPNGAVGDNARDSSSINVESQRWGADIIQSDVSRGDDAAPGIRMIRYGFAAEAPDGSFGPDNDFQHISFFLEAASRAVLILKESGDDRYRQVIQEVTSKVEKAARWFVDSGTINKQIKKGETFTHRYYLLAAALGEASQVTGDTDLAMRAERCAKMGLAKQQADGTNPEKGGFDVNYNAASGLFAERYYLTCGDRSLRSDLKAMISRSMSKENSAVLSSGELSMDSSTRTGQDLEHNGTGKKKGFDHKGIIQFYIFGAEITGEKQYLELAKKVADARGWR